jgi:hypothetical protein
MSEVLLEESAIWWAPQRVLSARATEEEKNKDWKWRRWRERLNKMD